MGGKIGFILLMVVILGFVLYVYNSGLVGKGAQGLSSLFPGSSTSTTSTSFINPPTGPSIPPSTIAPPGVTPTSSNAIDPSQIPPGFTAAQLSPFFHEIRIGQAYAGSGSNGQITLYASFSQNETIDVTGWQLKAERGGEFIPQAIAVYDPSGYTGANEIRLASGDTLYLYSSSAPFNVRINKCIGYIAQEANFNPPLPNNCPAVNRDDIQNFTGACQNFILSVGGCEQPDLSNPAIPQNDYACRDYIANNFTYRSCFDAHRNDSDFLSHQVWAWMGSNILDQFHDKLQLLDKNGLLVDIYTY